MSMTHNRRTSKRHERFVEAVLSKFKGDLDYWKKDDISFFLFADITSFFAL